MPCKLKPLVTVNFEKNLPKEYENHLTISIYVIKQCTLNGQWKLKIIFYGFVYRSKKMYFFICLDGKGEFEAHLNSNLKFWTTFAIHECNLCYLSAKIHGCKNYEIKMERSITRKMLSSLYIEHIKAFFLPTILIQLKIPCTLFSHFFVLDSYNNNNNNNKKVREYVYFLLYNFSWYQKNFS